MTHYIACCLHHNKMNMKMRKHEKVKAKKTKITKYEFETQKGFLFSIFEWKLEKCYRSNWLFNFRIKNPAEVLKKNKKRLHRKWAQTWKSGLEINLWFVCNCEWTIWTDSESHSHRDDQEADTDGADMLSYFSTAQGALKWSIIVHRHTDHSLPEITLERSSNPTTTAILMHSGCYPWQLSYIGVYS